MKIVIASGYFNPLHIGHLKYLQAARELGDSLLVIVNNNKQVALKGSVPFMDHWDRFDIIRELRCVDSVWLADDLDRTVRETITRIISRYPERVEFIFAKGGDSTPENTPEKDIIEVVYGVGGDKVQSSSTLIANATK